MCLSRSIYMEFEKDVEVKGIPAYRFTPPRSVLASKDENPANEGFCVSPTECLGTGLLKVSPCRKGKWQLGQRFCLFSHAALSAAPTAHGVDRLLSSLRLHMMHNLLRQCFLTITRVSSPSVSSPETSPPLTSLGWSTFLNVWVKTPPVLETSPSWCHCRLSLRLSAKLTFLNVHNFLFFWFQSSLHVFLDLWLIPQVISYFPFFLSELLMPLK